METWVNTIRDVGAQGRGHESGSPTDMRLPQLHPPMSSSNRVEHVFPVGTCTHKYTHTTYKNKKVR